MEINQDAREVSFSDWNAMLRTCEEEIIKPISGVVIGTIPEWINGSLLRNGPGRLKFGNVTVNHIFDSAALLHKFKIENGKVTYQCRFLKSESYKRNTSANRLVMTEIGTVAVPDPCQSIFKKFSTRFDLANTISDNAQVSIYPINDEYFAFGESPLIHKINPDTLDTIERLNMRDHFSGIISHTSHPHVMADGTVYNVGLVTSIKGPAYAVMCFPNGQNSFKDAHVVAELPARWKFHPGYMHTFGITDNYFVIVEQPLAISVPALVKSQIVNAPLMSCMKWFENEQTCFYLINRKTGKVEHTFNAETFFFFHIVNQYEKDDHVVIDICCYDDPKVINSFYVDSIKNHQHDVDFSRSFHVRPLRFVLPLSYPEKKNFITKIFTQNENPKNLVQLKDTIATAYDTSDGILCKPELLCNVGCDMPRFNNEKFLGKEYRYFYANEVENLGPLVKVDLVTKKTKFWSKNNVYTSEPIFIPSPNPKSEDDGVILACLLWRGEEEQNKVGLLVLDAVTMKELGRCEFINLPGEVPNTFHGWFANNKN